VANQTGLVGNTQQHVLDLLLEHQFKVTAIFSPEHGFRGHADAGEHVASSVDPQTGVPILSLYDGKDGKPSAASMEKFDLLIVDIQDVGLRFYTYYISMCKLMEACADNHKQVLILDRPNPNNYVDGPILDMKYKSGVGSLPIPVVYGLTLGELARMANGEGWLGKGRKVDLKVILCKNYTRHTLYRLPVPPSPNLPNMTAVYLYPSLCYFEATPVSLGRGVEGKAFQIYGHPNMKGYSFTFTPRSIPGAKNPPQLNRLCYGVDLSGLSDEAILKKGIDLSYLIDAYHNLNMDDYFFRPFFERLIGVGYVRKMIEAGKTADEIKAAWAADVAKFKQERKPYLLYKE
ncbi:MAG: DUF1343 domain-containing protein, partial [Tannerella sp.]|nr:DUF1343 domain-containing protein [Tannerella sp.]